MSQPAPKLPAPDAPAEPENEVRATFFEHLTELRKCLIRALLGVAIGMALVGYWSTDIYRWLMLPVLRSLPESQRHLIYTGYLEPFMVYLKVALYGGIFASAPYVLYQIWQFIAPALYKREKKVVVPFLFFGTLLFYTGGAFCYFLVMPYAFPALAAIAGQDMMPYLTMREQLTLTLAMIIGFGIVFEVPIILGFLSMIGLVSAEFLAKYRRHAIVVNVALAAIITPTGDPFNLALMAVPMIIFYEIGIILARIVGKKRKAAAEAASSA